MQTIKGTVLDSTQRFIKNADGTETVFYELMVTFGDGAVIISSGKPVSVGEKQFTISPRTMYDRKAKITVIQEEFNS